LTWPRIGQFHPKRIESGGKQRVSIKPEGDGDQDGSSEDGSYWSESSPEGAFEYVKGPVLKAGSSSYTPVTPIPLASTSVDPTSQSFGEGTTAVTPTSAFKSSDFPQVRPLALNLTTPFLTSSKTYLWNRSSSVPVAKVGA